MNQANSPADQISDFVPRVVMRVRLEGPDKTSLYGELSDLLPLRGRQYHVSNVPEFFLLTPIESITSGKSSAIFHDPNGLTMLFGENRGVLDLYDVSGEQPIDEIWSHYRAQGKLSDFTSPLAAPVVRTYGVSAADASGTRTITPIGPCNIFIAYDATVVLKVLDMYAEMHEPGAEKLAMHIRHLVDRAGLFRALKDKKSTSQP